MGKSTKRGSERTVRARALEVIEKQRGKMSDNLGAAIDGKDPEGVHDMRVASRRLRAALDAFEPWLDPKSARAATESLRRLTRTLGRVRELDILRLQLERLSSEASAALALAIELIDGRLARRLLRARRRMFKEIATLDVDALDRRLRLLVGAPPAWITDTASKKKGHSPWFPATHAAPADQPIQNLLEFLEPRIIKNVRRVTGQEITGEAGSAESSEALHEVRIRGKKLRYQLEIIEPFIGPEGARVIATLRGLQDRLGDYHDDVVLDEVLQQHMVRQSQRGHPGAVRELSKLRTQRRSLLEKDERACRETLARLSEDGFAETVAAVLAHAREKAAANARRRIPRTGHDTASPLTIAPDGPRLPPARPTLVRLPRPTPARTETSAMGERSEDPDARSHVSGREADAPGGDENQAAEETPHNPGRNHRRN